MLTYSFENKGNTPLYESLYGQIRDDILTGVLKPGEKLPSKRSFAQHLGISTITVENAYGQLAAEGYIQSMPKRGYYVAALSEVLAARPARPPVSPMIPQAASAQRIDFTSNQTIPENFPFSTWSRLVRELLSGQQEPLLTNPPCGGILPLRQAISAYLRDFRGMQVTPEQIIIGAGTEYLYGLILQLLGTDKLYAVEDPGYSKIPRIYNSHGARCVMIPMDKEGIQPGKLLEQQVDVVHISPSHHFPTGRVMPIGRRYELLAWASRQEGRYIIEDDYDSEFRLNGRPLPTLQSIDSLSRVIYINTFTKTLASTVRISYMVLPPELSRAFYERLSFYSCTVSNFEQYTLAMFMERGYFEKHINRMRNIYRAKRDLLLQAIEASPLKNWVSIAEEEAGLHFLLKVDTPLSDRNFCQQALTEGVLLNPLSHFDHQSSQPPEHVFVINYSSLREENVPEAVRRLTNVVRRSRG